ncbi:bladder cancer associated protein, transcript variant X2, partial [Columba livia]
CETGSWQKFCWVTGCCLPWDAVICSLDLEEGTKKTRRAHLRSCWNLLWVPSDRCCHQAPASGHHVLPAVAAARPAHTQAPQPSAVVQPLHVHGLLPAEFPPGTEALHDLCLGLPGSSVPHLLQLLGELLLVSLHRIPVARVSSRSQYSGHLGKDNLLDC